MATDLYKTVLFNDGEGLAHGDLNNVNGYINAKLFDQIIRARNGNGRVATGGAPFVKGTPSIAPFLYSLHGGTGFVTNGAGARQTTVRAGTIFQQVGSPSGDEASFLAYTMAENEFTLTHDVGDAQPRIDVIQVKLEHVNGNNESRDFEDATTEIVTSQSMAKKRRVQATFSIKKGTPGASPAVPTLDAGYAGLAIVSVTAAFNAVFTPISHYSHCAIPIGLKHKRIKASDFSVDSGASISLETTAAVGFHSRKINVLAGSTNETFWVPSGLLGHQRILGIQINGRIQFSSLTLQLREGSLAGLDGANSISLGSFLTSIGAADSYYIGAADLETAMATALSNAKNAEGFGRGVWGSGNWYGPIAVDAGGEDSREAVLKFTVSTGGGDTFFVTSVDFIYADGL